MADRLVCKHDDTWEDGITRFCGECGTEVEWYIEPLHGWAPSLPAGYEWSFDGWVAAGEAEAINAEYEVAK